MTDLERCDQELREIELLLRGGHADVNGLLLALIDWRSERGLLRVEQENADRYGARAKASGNDAEARKQLREGEWHEHGLEP